MNKKNSNDPSSPTAPTETQPLQPNADGAVRCSAWLGDDWYKNVKALNLSELWKQPPPLQNEDSPERQSVSSSQTTFVLSVPVSISVGHPFLQESQ